MKDKKTIIKIIKGYFNKSPYPVEKVWLFGSYARDEAQPGSDVNLIISFSKPNQIDLWDYAEILLNLEDLVEAKVDLVPEGRLKSFAQADAERNSILIYERKAEEQRASTTHP